MTIRVCALLLCALFCLTAADANVSDEFYSAIRRDDFAAVEKLLASGASVNTKDARGNTPLMYAAAAGSTAMMRRLIDAGADVNARNSFDATALHWCSNSLERVRLLADHGADVNARSRQGRTPLLLACDHAGGLEIVKLLLSKGASLKDASTPAGGPPPPGGSAANDALPSGGPVVAVAAAASANDTALVKFLLETGGPEMLEGPAGPMALMSAAAFGNTELVRLLLSKGVPVNAQSPSETERVKNGPIALGNFTALILSVAAGNPATVRVLLDAGADVNARDVRGMTPLMLAVATDHPNRDVIRLLLARKPDTAVKSKAGETALDWALKFRDSAIISQLRAAMPGAAAADPTPKAIPPRAPAPDLRTALQRTIPLVQKAGVTTFREGGCISCHGGNIVTAAVAAARARGLAIDEAAHTENIRATRLQFLASAESLLERTDTPDAQIPAFTLFALAQADVPPDHVTDALVHNLAALQLADGSWFWQAVLRPPTSDSPFSITALAIQAFRRYAPPARKAEFDERIARAAHVLETAEPVTTEDHVMRLLGLKWAGANQARVDRLAKALAALQRPDGGWGQTPRQPTDAYATGTALNALYQCGMPPDSPVYRRGVAFLLSTQAPDGSWHVASRAPKFQPYFEGGFPYGHDQWISQWGTGWAAVALAHALPQQRAAL